MLTHSVRKARQQNRVTLEISPPTEAVTPDETKNPIGTRSIRFTHSTNREFVDLMPQSAWLIAVITHFDRNVVLTR